MKFAAPENLLWLWALIPLCAFLVWAVRHRRGLLARFSQQELFNQIAKSYDSKRYRLKSFFLIAVIVLSVLALARPQWGYEIRDIKRRGSDILLIVDVSRSMLTKDVKPSRLERTKLAIKDLVKKLKGDRIGLIAFAGDAFLTCPLTVDYSGFLLNLDDLGPDAVARGGTNIAAAIEEALKEYDTTSAKYKAVIIITDGENLEEDPMSAVEKAKEKGIKIYSIGVGTKDGELIQIPNDKGETDFLKDSQGNFVKSRLDEGLLQKIALATGGIYVRASGTQFGLEIIYDQEIGKLEKRDFQTKSEKRYFERFQFPLFFALLFLILETVMPLRRRLPEGE
jgi:Ca-activated chloride channel family protein